MTSKKLSQQSSSVMSPMASTKSPMPHSASFYVTSDQVLQLLEILKQAQRLSTSSKGATPFGENEEKKGDEHQPKLRASKVDIRSVYEL